MIVVLIVYSIAYLKENPIIENNLRENEVHSKEFVCNKYMKIIKKMIEE
jgi:hypothetical protein